MDESGVTVTRHRFTVHDYHRMGEAGILGEDDRVELIEGEVIAMAPTGEDHVGTVNRLNAALCAAFADKAIVSPQNPVRLDDGSEPQPDFAVLRRRDDFYTGGLPRPDDVLLLIEVADPPLRFDRAVKLPLHARTGIPEVWIVNLGQRTVEIHRMPKDGTYIQAETARGDRGLTPALAPGVTISLRQVFG